MVTNDDQNLVGRIAAGDQTAFRELVDLYKRNVYGLAYDILGTHTDAEDASQEVFIKVFRSIHTFRRDAKMSSWLYQITVNASIDLMRRRSVRGASQLENMEALGDRSRIWGNPGRSEPARVAEHALLQDKIRTALGRISPRERTVFVMRQYNDFRIREIAEILDIQAGTVKSLFFRAVKKLRKELAQEIPMGARP